MYTTGLIEGITNRYDTLIIDLTIITTENPMPNLVVSINTKKTITEGQMCIEMTDELLLGIITPEEIMDTELQVMLLKEVKAEV